MCLVHVHSYFYFELASLLPSLHAPPGEKQSGKLLESLPNCGKILHLYSGILTFEFEPVC